VGNTLVKTGITSKDKHYGREDDITPSRYYVPVTTCSISTIDVFRAKCNIRVGVRKTKET